MKNKFCEIFKLTQVQARLSNMKQLINFRDLGCQGAREILFFARDIAKETVSPELKKQRKLVFLTKNKDEVSTSKIKTANGYQEYLSPFSLWKETADNLELEFEHTDTIANLKEQDIVIAQSSYKGELEGKKDIFFIAQDGENDFSSSSAVSAFSSLLYTSLRTGKDFHELSYAFIGDGGQDKIPYSNMLLNAALCMQLCLSLSFPEHSIENEELSLDRETLDFAMSAGAKVFLTYQPEFIPENCDVLYLSDWTHPQAAVSLTRHPYIYDKVNNRFTENTQVVSLIAEHESSAFDAELYTKAGVLARTATLRFIFETQ